MRKLIYFIKFKNSTDFVENGVTKKRTIFQETFRMSTYLATWAILPDDFDSVGLKSERGIDVIISFIFSLIEFKFIFNILSKLVKIPLFLVKKMY